MNSAVRYFYERKSCPVCGSVNHQMLFTCLMTKEPVRAFIQSHYQKQGKVDFTYLEGTDYTLLECDNCNLIYQRQAPTEVMLDVIYNEMVDPSFLIQLTTRSMTLQGFEEIAGELSVLMSLIGKSPANTQILDYGFGFGRWARVAAAMGAKVYATEISPEKISYAQKIGVEIIDDEALGHLQFDLVHTEQVFEHLTEPAREFGRLASALSPGGILKMAVPPLGRIKGLIASQGMINWSPQEQLWDPAPSLTKDSKCDDYVCVLPLEHLNAFSPRSVGILADHAGLDIVGCGRKRAVPVHFHQPQLFFKSLSNIAKELLRPVLRTNSGYYLFRAKQLQKV